MKYSRIAFLLSAAGCWIVIAALIFVVVPLGMFVIPNLIAGWKSQGVTEAPVIWQIVIDLADMAKVRGYIVFPVLILVASVLTVQTMRRNAMFRS